MKAAFAALPLLTLALAFSTNAFAQTTSVTPTPPDYPRGKISGYFFGDTYDDMVGNPISSRSYDAAGNDTDPAYISANGKPTGVIGKGLNGFQLRRVYFQLDNDLSAKFSTRFRLEADSKSLTSDGKVGVAVKAAYMQVRQLYPRADFFFGMNSTPTWENSEDYWSYRSIEKTIADFRGILPSTDIGAELKGFVDPAHVLGYTLMVGNGSGQKPETNRDKRTYLALPMHWRDWRLEPYVDYLNSPGARDTATYKVFAAWDIKRGAIGYEYIDQIGHVPAAAFNEAVGHSVFARWPFTDQVAAFARMDLWDPNLRTASRVRSQLWIAGVDYQPLKDVHFMPNVEATQYKAVGLAAVPPHHDLQARLTFFWKFSKPQS